VTFQAYLDTVKSKTGKTPEDFKKLAAEKGLTKHGEIVAWLKSDFELGHGHANAVTQVILHGDEPEESDDDGIAKHFTGAKASWHKPYDDLLKKLKKFGADIRVAPTSSYLSILRKDKKFAIVQITAKRMDIGIKLNGAPAEGRFEEAGAWNAMVTHRVRIEDPKQIDEEIITWLRQAYDKAG
jgi:predicted transport protein